MSTIKNLLFILFFSLSFCKGFGVEKITISETKIGTNIDMTIFFQLVDINIQQKRRTYFGVNEFSIEEKIANIWSSHIKDFIKSNSIVGIKFMSIEMRVPFAYCFIVSDKSIYKLSFRQNEDQGIFYLESQKNVLLKNKNNFFQEINNLQKSYFTIDTELWPNRFNLTRVFSMFLRIPINDKSESESPLTNFYKIGKKHKYWGAYTIRYPDKELDVILKRLGDGFK